MSHWSDRWNVNIGGVYPQLVILSSASGHFLENECVEKQSAHHFKHEQYTPTICWQIYAILSCVYDFDSPATFFCKNGFHVFLSASFTTANWHEINNLNMWKCVIPGNDYYLRIGHNNIGDGHVLMLMGLSTLTWVYTTYSFRRRGFQWKQIWFSTLSII